MSVHETSLNISELQSTNESTAGYSLNNYNLSKTSVTQILAEEPSSQNISENGLSRPKLNNTLDPMADDRLQNMNGHNSQLTKPSNGSSENAKTSGTSGKNESIDKEIEKGVIAVEDDDDVMELTSPVIDFQEKNMSAHLHKETTEENINLVDQEKDSISTEENLLGVPQKESNLQQHSFIEKIIPVEDDEDDLMEISNIDTAVKEMSNVLQNETQEESFLEDEILSQDESSLFQYSFIEVGRRLWPSTMEKQSYTKGCLWSPDGTCLLVPVHLDGMHVVELPIDLYTLLELPEDRDLSNLPSAVYVKEGGTVYDCCWYPHMTSLDPATCCWLATRKHEPIHMWDAFTGELRCSYRGYDDVDEVESAISITFSNDGLKVIGGYKKTIKIFDTNSPSRQYVCVAVKKAISCLALSTDNDNCVTAGTWAGCINHYDLRAAKMEALFTLSGHSGGITWLKYSPNVDQSWYLFSGARKDNKILHWDMRNYTEPIKTYERNVRTNQRIFFDLTPLNMWLGSGDTEGLLRIWNLTDPDIQFELPLHQDCCNGVSFHPSLPIVTTTSGQYHFADAEDAEDNSTEKIVNYENSLMMLWYGPSKSIRDSLKE